MWICQDDRQPPTYLSGSPLLSSVTPNHPPLPVPYPPHPLAGRDLGIPAVTQELPPLLSAFFSSRSESQTSLGPNPSGQGGRLYRSYCFHEIGIWSIFLTQKTLYFTLEHYNLLNGWPRELLSNWLVSLVVPRDLQHFLKNDFPFLDLEKGSRHTSLKCSSCCSLPFPSTCVGIFLGRGHLQS